MDKEKPIIIKNDAGKNMTKKEFQKGIRKAIIARNTIQKMGKHSNFFSEKYLNQMACDAMTYAKTVHPLLPYYLITGRI